LHKVKISKKKTKCTDKSSYKITHEKENHREGEMIYEDILDLMRLIE